MTTPPLSPDRWSFVLERFEQLADATREEQDAAVRTLATSDADVASALAAMLHADRTDHPSLDRALRDGVTPLVELLLDGSAAPTSPHCGPWALGARVGEGGSGLVFRATRADVGATAAVKVLRDAWLSAERRARFLAEARMLATLSHPGIARFLDAGETSDGTPWIAMELVDGEPITSAANASGASLDVRLRWIAAACDALQHAHDQALLHRDLKPSNLFVARDGAVRLLDFGIAKRLQDATGAIVEHTRTGFRLLTPAYASPEQLRGDAVTVRSDVYALGVVLHELLTGVRPVDFGDDGTEQAVRRIETAYPPTLRGRLQPSLPDRLSAARVAELGAIVATALHPDATRRYPSARALAEDLRRFLALQPLAARTPSLPYRAGLFMRRHRGAIIVAGGLALLTTFGAVRYARDVAAADRAAAAEAERAMMQRDFLLSLVQGGAATSGDPSAFTLSTLVANGTREVATFAGDVEARMEMYGLLGALAAAARDPEAADSLTQRAIALKEARLGPHHPETLRQRLARLTVFDLLGERDSTVGEAERLSRLVREHVPLSHPVRAEAALLAGRILGPTGQPDSAHAEFRRAAAHWARWKPGSREQGVALRYLGQNRMQAGRTDSARLVLEESARVLASVVGETHPDVAIAEFSLGQLAGREGDFVAADTLISRALRVMEAWYGPDHAFAAGMRNQLATVMVRSGRAAEALPILRQNIEDVERQVSTGHPMIGFAMTYMAQAYAALGDTMAELVYRDTAIMIFANNYGESSSDLLRERERRVVWLARHGRLAEGLQELRALVAATEARLPADHPELAGVRLRLGMLEAQAGRLTEARALLEQALPHASSTVLEDRERRAEAEAALARVRAGAPPP